MTGVRMDNEGTYQAICDCGWEMYDIETIETAGHLLDLHRGEEHFDE